MHPSVRGRFQAVEKLFRAVSGPGLEAEYAVFVLFRTCFRALLGRPPGRHLLFQQAGVFCELLRPKRRSKKLALADRSTQHLRRLVAAKAGRRALPRLLATHEGLKARDLLPGT